MTLLSLWSESNSISGGLTFLNSSENANGSTTGTWANAGNKWLGESWEFVIEDTVITGTINSVTLYLKHYQSGRDDDTFKIQVWDGSTWTDFDTTYPTSDTTENWSVTSILNTWEKINACKVRITSPAKAKAEDIVTWYVDTVEIRIDYTEIVAGFKKIAYTSEPPTPNAWNQIKRDAGTGWRKLLFEGE